MGAAKKGNSGPLVPPVLGMGFRWLIGPGRPFAVLLLIAAVFGGGWWFAWRSVGPWLLGQKDYLLTPDDIEITPPPKWIQSSNRNLAADAFVYISLDSRERLSILEDNLVDRVAKAFALQPWVAQVVSVRKFHPAKVKVELVYRRPACMVQVEEDRPGDWLPIDAEGVLLPAEDFTPLEKQRYPRLTGIAARPVSPPGVRWPDPRIAGAAEIATALDSSWERLGLDHIAPVAAGLSPQPAGPPPQFCLITRRGTQIYWGRATGGAVPGEILAAEKAAKLDEYFKESGTLDTPQAIKHGLDVTRSGSIEASAAGPEAAGTR